MESDLFTSYWLIVQLFFGVVSGAEFTLNEI
jgi:hypothetical protein